MNVTDERAPLGFFLTPTERDNLRAKLAEIEQRAVALSAEIGAALADMRACPVHEPGDPDCTPTHGGACLGRHDPLAAFRLPSGAVAFETTYADRVRVGDWVQRCHGDPDWHLVEDVQSWPAELRWVRITHDGTAHDYRAVDAIRVARPPADVVARQEQREAGR